MNEKDYHYTLTIAACKSFSRAAEVLYISQPALSRYISKLETELGVKLFNRSSSPLQLTSAGNRFCSYATTILELENNMIKEFEKIYPLSTKNLKIGAPFLTGEHILSRILPRIITRFANILIDPIQDYSAKLLKRLTAHQIDAAFICEPVSLADSSLSSEFLFYEDVYLIANRSHPALKNYDTANASIDNPLIIDVSNLADVSLIHCKPIAILSFLAEESLMKMNFKPTSAIKTSSLPLALDLTSQGIGFTSVMHCQLKYGSQSIVQSLCPILLDNCKVPFYIAYDRKNRNSTPELDILIKEIVDEFENSPYL